MTILVVEDDAPVALAIKVALQAEGHDAHVAYHAAAARAAWESTGYDLILLDLELPDGNGLELLTELRSRSHPIPVIITTGRDGLEDRIAGLDCGADDYLVKPVALDELHARIRSVMRRTADTSRMRLQVSDLVLDVPGRTVTRGATQIELTQREFELLEYMMIKKNQIVSKEMLATDIWKLPSHAAPIDNAIAVHMSHLRDKVDRDFENPLIHTEKGKGYVIRGATTSSDHVSG